MTLLQEAGLSRERQGALELQQKGVLLASGLFYPEGIICNRHLERPLRIEGASFDEVLDHIHALKRPVVEMAAIYDIYYVDVGGTFATNGIHARLRMHEDPRGIVSVKNIGTFDLGDSLAAVPLGDSGLLFKPETVYLNKEEKDIPGFIGRFSESAGNAIATGIVTKSRVRFRGREWEHIQLPDGSQTMGDTWVNLIVDKVSLVGLKGTSVGQLEALSTVFDGTGSSLVGAVEGDREAIREGVVMIEIEGSRSDEAMVLMGEFAEKIEAMPFTTIFQEKRKGALIKPDILI